MFQLYKKRDFSSYITDTIMFFKHYWKNYFANFIVITGALLLVLCVIFYFIFKDIFGALIGGNASGYDFSSYFQDNWVSFAILVGIAVLVTILFSLACMSYPVAYLQLVEKTKRKTFTSSELLDQMKSQLSRIFIFGLLSFIILFPLLMIVAVISVLAIFLVIGIFLIFMLIPVFTVWVTQALFVYLNENTGFFEALGRSWSILFNKKFWHIVGSTFVVYMAISIIQSIFSVIPYLIMFFSFFITEAGPNVSGTKFTFVVTALYVLAIISSYIFSNFLMITQGLIYYSSLEQKEHTQAFYEIDMIGQNVE